MHNLSDSKDKKSIQTLLIRYFIDFADIQNYCIFATRY